MTVEPARPSLRRRSFVPRTPIGERLNIDGVGDDSDLVGRNATRHDVAAQPIADGGDVIGSTHRAGLESPGQAVAHATFARRAVIDGRIFPEGANLRRRWGCHAAARREWLAVH